MTAVRPASVRLSCSSPASQNAASPGAMASAIVSGCSHPAGAGDDEEELRRRGRMRADDASGRELEE